MQPETKYAKSGDLNVAYQVLGQPAPDLVFVPGLLSNVDTIWSFPASARFFRRLAAFSRVILYDKRGQGSSDAGPGVPTLEQDMEDLLAVLDAVGSERATLFGYSEGGPVSALFAATYPDRTSGLIGLGTFAASEEPEKIRPGAMAAIRDAVEHWGEGRSLDVFGPSAASDERRRQFGAVERAVGSPARVRARMTSAFEADVRAVLPSVRVPALVIHRMDELVVPTETSRNLAELIPEARYVEVPGIDHIPWIGDSEAILDEVEEFVTGARHAAEPDRMLATVLFTDIAASTQRVAELGDRRWRDLIERHDLLVRTELDNYRGDAVKSMGDGFLATFDGPARGIRCACALTKRVRELGIEVRAGLHTGECEMLSGDVGGIAVNIGARVGALAQPGEVLVSSTVKDLVAGSGLEFADRGPHVLKGVPGEWRLYAVADG
jgi:pimeloyl-ACP methyl ester carboxylesterase/class 3 adenylate cyclase